MVKWVKNVQNKDCIFYSKALFHFDLSIFYSTSCMQLPVRHISKSIDVPGLLEVLVMPLLVLGHVPAFLAHHQPVYPAVAPHNDHP